MHIQQKQVVVNNHVLHHRACSAAPAVEDMREQYQLLLMRTNLTSAVCQCRPWKGLANALCTHCRSELQVAGDIAEYRQ